ncbi:MAG TPA: helix-turn-helix domain-containing protein [Burkholderiaceae bacterium]|nr:helix-turn-helix domain-containing protein [Burkholderiaceae bacterium]
MDHKRPLPFPPPLQPFAAPADLRPWIEGAVIVRAPAGLGRSCFPGRVSSQLVLRLSGTVRQVPPGDGAEAAAAPLLPAAALIGPSTQPSTFAHEGEVSAVGLILRPEAVAGWLGPIGAQLADHTTALDAVDGPSWNAVLDALQEARDDRERLTLLFDALRRRVQRHPRQEDARCRALQLQRDAGLLPGGTAAPQAPGTRQLQRLFAGTFGMGPKQFQRLLRLRELLHGALRDPSAARGRGAALAQEAGFFDQSHLARDLRGLAGAALTELLRQVQPGNDGTPGEQWPLAMGAAVDSTGNSPTRAG